MSGVVAREARSGRAFWADDLGKFYREGDVEAEGSVKVRGGELRVRGGEGRKGNFFIRSFFMGLHLVLKIICDYLL